MAGGEIHGCPFNYEYSDDLGTCFPSGSDLGFYPVLDGSKPFPTTLGGVIGFVGNSPGDILQVGGPLISSGAESLGDTLVNFGDGGGPIGWGIQGLGYTVGFAGDTVGGLAQGAGAIIDIVSGGVGAVIDDIGSAFGSLFRGDI